MLRTYCHIEVPLLITGDKFTLHFHDNEAVFCLASDQMPVLAGVNGGNAGGQGKAILRVCTSDIVSGSTLCTITLNCVSVRLNCL